MQADSKLYTIADLSTAWVYANVSQTDVGRLKPGNPATVTVDAYPGRHFSGRIDQILPQVDPMTRTVRVRLVFSNPGVVLKPGMYVNATIGVPLGRQVVVPASAVLQAGTRQIAFIDHGQGYLEPRVIEVGPRVDDRVAVLKGLRLGDRVVSSANFPWIRKLSFRPQWDRSHLHRQVPVPAAMNAPPSKSIDLSTEPDPLHKGENAVHKADGADGKPVTGAEVSVIFHGCDAAMGWRP